MSSAPRRRMVSSLLIACLVIGAAGLLGRDLIRDLVARTLGEPAEAARPLSPAEADRLAQMRQHNFQDGRAGVRAEIGPRDRQVYAVGWVDWQRPMVYLSLSGDQPGVITELVQAVPGLAATHPGPPAQAAPPPGPSPASPASPTSPGPAIVDPYPPPPVEPPADGWQLRRPGTDPALETLVRLLFTIAADHPDAADLLARSESQWLRRDHTAGHEVDVLLGPAVPPSPRPTPAEPETERADWSLAAMGGGVQYWLDQDARLHRLDALLAPDIPARVDLDRADRTAPPVLDLLGGAAIDPRPVTDEQAETLAGLRQRNHAAGGGEITLTLPDEQAEVRAAGWLSWRAAAAYLTVSGADGDAQLVYADRTGVAGRPAEPEADGSPPLPVPRDEQWRWSPWEARGDEHGGFDLDLLLHEALALGAPEPDDPDRLRATARMLRTDQLAGEPVTVYEVPRDFEAELPPGEARMRYWVDGDGLLRRLEIRTRSNGYGRLDLTPGPLPPGLSYYS